MGFIECVSFVRRLKRGIEEAWMFLSLLAVELLGNVNVVGSNVHVYGLFLRQQVLVVEHDGTFRYVARGALVRTGFARNDFVRGFAVTTWVNLKILRDGVSFGRFARFDLIQIYRGRTYARVLGRLQWFHAYKLLRRPSSVRVRCLPAGLGSSLQVDNLVHITWIDWLHLDSLCFDNLLGNQISHLLQIGRSLIFWRSLTLLLLGLATSWSVLVSFCRRWSTRAGLSRRWIIVWSDWALFIYLHFITFLLFFLYQSFFR